MKVLTVDYTASDAAERFASTSALERCVHEVQKRSAAFISRYFAKKRSWT